MIHNSLREKQTLSKWSPTPQEIVESNDDIDRNLFNLVVCSSESSNSQ